MDERKSYAVIIPYREPGFELRRGAPRKDPFTARYEVEATTEEEAVELAIHEFRETARNSGVAWQREIQHADIHIASSRE